ncbi:ABC transporter permease [Gemmobacter denitrificans]|uniref:Transport permease protein n=1 Tax=Gemmobacter denitrificans TaxID=3123040 RepID=A0ABU8C151_9RHOB
MLPAPPSPDPGALPDWRRRARRDGLATGRTILALMLREMSTRYGRSPGGYLWAVMEPLGSTLIMALGFALVMRHPPLGTSFILFFATGMLPFTLYNALDTVVGRALNYSRALLMYPAVRWIDAVLARFLLNLLTKLVIMLLVLAGVLVATDTSSVLDFGPILAAVALAALLGLATGLVNCALEGLFPAWGTIWAIATRPLFLASGVVLLYEDLPRIAQDVLWWNPLLHVIGEFRTGFYPMYTASYVSIPYVAGVGLALLALGVMLVRRHHVTILRE